MPKSYSCLIQLTKKRLVPKEGKKPTDSIKDLAVLHRKTKRIGEAEVTLATSCRQASSCVERGRRRQSVEATTTHTVQLDLVGNIQHCAGWSAIQ